MISQVSSSIPFDSNIFFVSGDRTALIDTGTGLDSVNVISEIESLLDGRRLNMIILTHCHYDHVGGLKEIMDHFDCEAYAGGMDAIPIRSADPKFTLYDHFDGELEPTDVSDLLENDIIDLGDHRLRVIDTPGHTSGGICLYDEVTLSLFSGDTVFGSGVGRTDFASGSSWDLIDSLKKLSKINIKTLYPGHGPSMMDGNSSVRFGLKIMGGYQ